MKRHTGWPQVPFFSNVLDEDFDDYHVPPVTYANDRTFGENMEAGNAKSPADAARARRAMDAYRAANPGEPERRAAAARNRERARQVERLNNLDWRLDHAMTRLWEQRNVATFHAPRALIIAAARVYEVGVPLKPWEPRTRTLTFY